MCGQFKFVRFYQNTHLPFLLPQSNRTLSNSIKRMINGFVGKFEIDDGIYDSKDFRLVFNSIAATCKATENCFGLGSH
ncbi:hypothetical protein BLOT_011785 [Blomia tropicalis]|nr:hypothetical protein BLOT_011785 [Blomia tropicalis]